MNVTIAAEYVLRAEGPETLRYTVRTDAKTDRFEVFQVNDQQCYEVLRDHLGFERTAARVLMHAAETIGSVTAEVPFS